MLISCVIYLKTPQEALVPPGLGQVLHAFFLDSVRALDPVLARQLHKSAALKPFTISPLWGKAEYIHNRWRLSPREQYTFRITAYSAALAYWLTEIWLPNLPGEINLAGAGFTITGFTWDSDVHPWAGITSYEDLYDNAIVGADARVPPKLTLQFYSPTTFRSQGINHPMPDPVKVFANLLQKWNEFSPMYLGDDFPDFIRTCVFPGAYQLSTRITHFNQYKQVGFVGQCSFGVRKHSEDILVQAVQLLADFALYAGIGYKTTMGMGQVRRI